MGNEEELQVEVNRGKKLIEALVEHLARMGAVRLTFPCHRGNMQWIVTVERKP